MSIVEKIKWYMGEAGLNYEKAAQKIGWTKPNLWDKLNKRTEVSFGSVEKIVSGLDATVEITKTGETLEVIDLGELAEAVQDEQVSFGCVERILNMLGYSIEVYFPMPDSEEK